MSKVLFSYPEQQNNSTSFSDLKHQSKSVHPKAKKNWRNIYGLALKQKIIFSKSLILKLKKHFSHCQF